MHGKADQALRKRALAYPETREDHPWGHTAMKVRGKVFLFMGDDEDGWGISVKLPDSGGLALSLPFAEPTGYGLGKSGWVSARFGPKDKPPIDLLLEWLDESYRAIAPKKVLALLGGRSRTSTKPTKAKPKPAKVRRKA
jgi:predicted DNA-binding protein (MmcQ/YjbR family)